MWEFLSQNLRNKISVTRFCHRISVTDFFSRIWGMRETNTNSKLELEFFAFLMHFLQKKAVFDATPFFEVASGLFVTIFDFLFLCSVLLAFQACVLSSCLISTAAVPVQACSFVFSCK